MPQLFQQYSEPPFSPFLVKMDIEGGEREVFNAEVDWVQRVPLIMIELHDWLLPGQGTSRPFLRCVSKLDRDFVYLGETVFSIDNSLGRDSSPEQSP